MDVFIAVTPAWRPSEPDPYSQRDQRWLRKEYDSKKGILRKVKDLLYEVDPIERLEANIGTVLGDLEKMSRWAGAINPQRRRYFGSLDRVQYNINELIKILKATKVLIRLYKRNEDNMQIVNKCSYEIQGNLDWCQTLIDDILSEFCI